MSEVKPLSKREIVDSFIVALIAGKIKINPDGWTGASGRWIRHEDPVGALKDFGEKILRYVYSEQPEALADGLLGELIALRLSGIVSGEVPDEINARKLLDENKKLKGDLTKLLEAMVPEASQSETPGPYS
jgi:hypothetical protein